MQRKGVHALLEIPLVYNLSQALSNREKVMRVCDGLVGDFTGCAILDIGCGLGHECLRYKGGTYYGLDISEDYIAEAKKRYSDYGKFFCGSVDDLEALDLPEMDVVIMIGVFHHLTDEQIKELMKILKNIMKPKFRLVSCDPVLIKRQNPIARFLASMDRGMHVRYFDNYIKLMQESGFNVSASEVDHNFFPPYDRLLMKVVK